MPRSTCNLTLIADEVRRELNLPIETVYEVLNKGFRHIAQQLHKRSDVSILRLGIFKVREDEHGLPKVKFTPSHLFLQHISVRPEMNKYGVLLDQNKAATAKLSGKCPKCNTDLESIDPPKCPACGTQPFEERMQHEDGNG